MFLHQYTSKHLLRNNIKIKLTEEFTIIYLHLHFILIFWMYHKLSFTWVQQITSTYLQLKFKEKQKEKCKLISSILNWIDIIGNFYFLWHGQTIIKRLWFRIPPHTAWIVLKKTELKFQDLRSWDSNSCETLLCQFSQEFLTFGNFVCLTMAPSFRYTFKILNATKEVKLLVKILILSI